MRDGSDDPSHHEQTLLPRSYCAVGFKKFCHKHISDANKTVINKIKKLNLFFSILQLKELKCIFTTACLNSSWINKENRPENRDITTQCGPSGLRQVSAAGACRFSLGCV